MQNLSLYQIPGHVKTIIVYVKSCPQANLKIESKVLQFSQLPAEMTGSGVAPASMISSVTPRKLNFIFFGFQLAVQFGIQNRLQDLPINRAGRKIHFL